MAVARKTKRKTAGKSGRKPTTVTIGAARRSGKSVRKTGATIVTAGGRGTPVRPASGQPKKPGKRTRKSGKDHGVLPSWSQLESKVNRKVKSIDGSPYLDAVSTVRFALVLAIVAASFTLYVGHVHATQDLLARTQIARAANHKLYLKHNRIKGQYDRLTGPAEIHRRAHSLGLVEDAAYGPTIILED